MTEHSKNPILDQLERVQAKPKKKKTINQKHKGKVGETWFADKLSEISGLHFHRIFASGAAVGQKNAKKLDILTQAQAEAQLGDIQSPEQLLYYLIWESKNYAELEFHQLIQPKFCTQITKWLDELEFDMESALYRMKDLSRVPLGFLCVKVTRKGAWIVGNGNYLKEKIKADLRYPKPLLTFFREPSEKLREKGYGNDYFMTDFLSFIEYNKETLFAIDTERMERLKKAQEEYERIMKGE